MNNYLCGVICSNEEEKTRILSIIIEEVFNYKTKNPKKFLEYLIKTFNDKKNIFDEKVNLLCYNKKIFINRIFPICMAYDGIFINHEKYKSTQVLTLLGYDNITIYGIFNILSNFEFMMKNMKKNIANQIWKDIQILKKQNLDKDKTKPLHYHILYKKYNKFKNKYIIIENFINGIYMMGYDISYESFDLNTIQKYKNKAFEKINIIAKDIKDYINVFNNEDSNKFYELFEKIKNINNFVQKFTLLCSDYGLYSHTEYILYYYIKFRKKR